LHHADDLCCARQAFDHVRSHDFALDRQE
jgi:hypothetical protein